MKPKKSRLDIVAWSFIKISGEDAYIVKQCERGSRRKIAFIGVSVFFILLLTFVSFFLAFYRVLNENWIASSILSVFIGLIYFTLYQFLNYTLSKNVLPREKSDTLIKFSRGISITLRVGFICFLAFIVGQLLMGSTLGNTINGEMDEFKKTKIDLLESSFMSSNSSLKKEKFERYKAMVQGQYFFVQRLKKLESNPLAWVITFVVILIFLIPILLKLLIKLDSGYYLLKRQLQRSIIDSSFKEFTEDLEQIMTFHFTDLKKFIDKRHEQLDIAGLELENAHENVLKKEGDGMCLPFRLEFTSPFLDPPYNTKRKKAKAIKTDEDFIDRYLKG